MTRWQVRLEGENFDLEDLPGMFTGPNLRILERDGGHYLESMSFERFDEAAAVGEEARRLIPMINGAARLHSRSYRNVGTGSEIVELTPDGKKKSQVIIVDTVAIRSKVSAVLVTVGEEQHEPAQPGSSEEDKWLKLAAEDKDVADALVIWGSNPHDWMNLYKLFEIVESREDVKANHWASHNEITRFTRTANHPEAAGSDARHGRSNQQPPPRPMTLSEGDAFVERVFTAWLRSLT